MKNSNNLTTLMEACGFTHEDILQIARDTKCYKRASNKIDIVDLLNSMCSLSIKGTVSHREVAFDCQTKGRNSEPVSKQAYSKFINRDECVNFFDTILSALLKFKIKFEHFPYQKKLTEY